MGPLPLFVRGYDSCSICTSMPSLLLLMRMLDDVPDLLCYPGVTSGQEPASANNPAGLGASQCLAPRSHSGSCHPAAAPRRTAAQRRNTLRCIPATPAAVRGAAAAAVHQGGFEAGVGESDISPITALRALRAEASPGNMAESAPHKSRTPAGVGDHGDENPKLASRVNLLFSNPRGISFEWCQLQALQRYQLPRTNATLLLAAGLSSSSELCQKRISLHDAGPTE
ncbi:hypothetical protein CH63R_04669 [Colletotrichum higginsianum IMI 349063]|uniref:Uncharacterized protein n=1 Tax=Colletotrichum higginsianum (strain IMI 349063) TaxID=759273 RepID=A0A1B7YJX2_COLHI|nr:hypothetical protein CH63R_04669 [Colletotrichum higginsianum IMI 349063]OBR12373.1 hypothetical protein CH63R_04669 [Colletotrichum higginsianum IMI 349063]